MIGWVAEAKVVVLENFEVVFEKLAGHLESWLVAKATAVVVLLLVLEFLSVGLWLRSSWWWFL